MTSTLNLIAAHVHSAGATAQNILEISNDIDPRDLASQGALDGIECINLNFPKFTDGRAFSQAFLLRRRMGFKGDIRATGDVLIDQLVQMQRSGFSSAVLREGVDASAAQRQFERYAALYQGDAVTTAPFMRGLRPTLTPRWPRRLPTCSRPLSMGP